MSDEKKTKEIDIDAVMAENAALKNENNVLTQDIEDAKAARKELEKDVKKLKAENTKLVSEVEDLKRVPENMKRIEKKPAGKLVRAF